MEAVRDLTTAADRIGALGEATANEVQTSLDQAASSGPTGRVQLVDALGTTVQQLAQDLQTIDVGAHGWLLPPLRSARDDFVRHLGDADTRLEDGQATLATLRSFLVGPRRYLILGGNNSEMRSMGIATTSGVATISNGAVEVGKFQSGLLTSISKPGVPIPEGWDWLYGYLDPGNQYSNMVASPNFPLVGQVANGISSNNTYGAVDGVIYVDTVSLQALLSIVGPVTVEGVTYTDQNAAAQLINENYIRFSAPDQSERREAQGRVANAIFDALNERHVPLVKLAAQLQDLARGRHLAAWSALASEEELWRDVGADGARSPNDVLVAWQELGTSKLDFYVTGNVEMTVRREGDYRRISLSMSATNPLRTSTAPYIDGGSMYAVPGEYGFYLTVYLPRDTLDIKHDDPSWNAWAMDGDLQVTTFIARAPAGSSRTIELSFLLPDDETSITVQPSARLRPVVWSWDGYVFDDREPVSLSLVRVEVGPEDPLPGWLLSGLLLFGFGGALAGDAWGRPATRQARIDANLGWWLLVIGLAMMAAQTAIYIRVL